MPEITFEFEPGSGWRAWHNLPRRVPAVRGYFDTYDELRRYLTDGDNWPRKPGRKNGTRLKII